MDSSVSILEQQYKNTAKPSQRKKNNKPNHYFLVLIWLLGWSLGCRPLKQVQNLDHIHRVDSLALWQWDDLVLVHERLDSTGTRPTERSTLRWHKTQHLAQHQRQDSLHHSHTTSNPRTVAPRRPFWLRLPWWLYLVFVLILGILALRLWHILRPLLYPLFRYLKSKANK